MPIERNGQWLQLLYTKSDICVHNRSIAIHKHSHQSPQSPLLYPFPRPSLLSTILPFSPDSITFHSPSRLPLSPFSLLHRTWQPIEPIVLSAHCSPHVSCIPVPIDALPPGSFPWRAAAVLLPVAPQLSRGSRPPHGRLVEVADGSRVEIRVVWLALGCLLEQAHLTTMAHASAGCGQ